MHRPETEAGKVEAKHYSQYDFEAPCGAARTLKEKDLCELQASWHKLEETESRLIGRMNRTIAVFLQEDMHRFPNDQMAPESSEGPLDRIEDRDRETRSDG
jgi:hypothetical protein